MDDTIQMTIGTLIAKVNEKTKELAELKRTINFLAKEANRDPIYEDEVDQAAAGGGTIRPDEFYGKPPTTAAREYLEKRGRAVPAEEILAALERGGFDFREQGWSKSGALRSLSISLSKNSLIFHRLPNGTYGLVKFYPDVQAKKQKKTVMNGSGTSEDDQADDQSDEPVDGEGQE